MPHARLQSSVQDVLVHMAWTILEVERPKWCLQLLYTVYTVLVLLLCMDLAGNTCVLPGMCLYMKLLRMSQVMIA